LWIVRHATLPKVRPIPPQGRLRSRHSQEAKASGGKETEE
jgi:hypothetical protein